MARPKGSRNTLIAITYDTIGELAGGIAGDTARQYAQRGRFDPRNLDTVLAWVNTRRQRLGLPMIGVPDGDNQVDAPTTTSTPAPLETGSLLAYDPRTGCFREDSDA